MFTNFTQVLDESNDVIFMLLGATIFQNTI